MLDIYSGLGDKMKIVIRGHPTTTLIQPNYNTLLLIMYTYLLSDTEREVKLKTGKHWDMY